MDWSSFIWGWFAGWVGLLVLFTIAVAIGTYIGRRNGEHAADDGPLFSPDRPDKLL